MKVKVVSFLTYYISHSLPLILFTVDIFAVIVGRQYETVSW